MALKVILDSNFLLIPSQFKIDIFESMMHLLNQRYEPIILSSTLHELQTMGQRGSPKLRKQVQIALKLAQKCHMVEAERGKDETNDDVIIRIATEWRSPVATNDRELIRKLRNQNVPVIFMRGKSRLELEGAL